MIFLILFLIDFCSFNDKITPKVFIDLIKLYWSSPK